jgi:TP901 family phage tail tape measure protein
MAEERLLIRVDEKGTRVVQRRLRGVGTAAASATSQTAALKGALGALGGAFIAREAVRTLASFGQEMSTVAAVTGATGAEFEALTERAKNLGATTRFTASQAAAAMTNLARAGFSVSETMETVGDTLLLAQAGALDLETAASITAATLRGFRLETDQAGRVTDVLAKAANSANTTVEQLGEGMKFVAPVAAGLGVSLEETTAAMTALSDAGLQATLAGTGLRRTLSELESPSSKTKKLLRQLGLEAEEYRVSQVGLTEALKRLKEAGVDTGLALELFGDRGGPSFEIMSSNIPKVEEMTKKLKNARGETKRIADIMDDNLNGALLRVKSAIESVILSFGKVKGSVLQKMFEDLASAVRWLGENVGILQGLLTGLAIVTLPLVLKALKSVFLVINKHPIFIIILAVSSLIGWLVKMKDELKVTEDGLTSLGDVFRIVWEDITAVVNLAIEAIKSILKDIGIEFNDTTTSIGEGFLKVIRTVTLTVDGIVAIMRGGRRAIDEAFENIPDTFKFIFFEMGVAVVKAVQWIINKFGSQINDFLESVEAQLILIQAGPVGDLLGLDMEDILLGRVEFKQMEIPENPWKVQGEKVGEAFLEGFLESGTPATDYVDLLIDRASIDRKKRELEELRRMRAPTEGGPMQGPALGPFAADPFRLGAGDEIGAARFKAEQVAEAANRAAEGFGDAKGKAFEFGEYVTGELNQGLEDTVRGLMDIAGAVSGALTNALDSATGALADFAISGFQNVEDLKKAFSDLFASLAKDILQLVLKILLLKAIGIAFGEGGGLLGNLVGQVAPAGKQAGGPTATGIPVIVGEKRPEIFVPPSQGNIIPSLEGLQQPPPPVNVIVVDDEKDLEGVMKGPAGEQATIAHVTRNRDQLKRVLT